VAFGGAPCVALCEGYLETLGYVPADDKRAWECAVPHADAAA
jgi:hypothetical protein